MLCQVLDILERHLAQVRLRLHLLRHSEESTQSQLAQDLQKRPTKETQKKKNRFLEKKPRYAVSRFSVCVSRCLCLLDPHTQSYKRDLQKRPTKESPETNVHGASGSSRQRQRDTHTHILERQLANVTQHTYVSFRGTYFFKLTLETKKK